MLPRRRKNAWASSLGRLQGILRIARTPPGAVLLGVFALNDSQLALVMTAAGGLPVDKHSVFLERVAARLRLHGPRFTDADLNAAIQAALTGLIQSAA